MFLKAFDGRLDFGVVELALRRWIDGSSPVLASRLRIASTRGWRPGFRLVPAGTCGQPPAASIVRSRPSSFLSPT